MDITDIAKDCEKELGSVIAPRTAAKIFGLEFGGGEIYLRGTNVVLKGDFVNACLYDCEACAVLAVTIGYGADNLLRRAQVNDMVKAALLDDLANRAVSELLVQTLVQLKTDFYKSDIFTPGCGDFSITCQNQLLDILGAYKSCGIAVTTSGALLPIKSMTGIAGLSREKKTAPRNICGECGNCFR